MRITHEGADKLFSFGVDRINGVFFQVEMKDEDVIYNWSEFSPILDRFTFENIQAAMKNGIFTKEEFKEVAKIPFGEEFSLYFSSVITTRPVGEDFKYPKAILKYYENGKGFKVKCLGDYMKILKHFKEPVTFGFVEWYKGVEKVFDFYNDYALKFLE